MTAKFILQYLSRSVKEIGKLSDSKLSNLYMIYDFLKCSIAHGCILNQYTRGEFYKLKGCERRKSMTYRRICRLYRQLNDPLSIHLLENKVDFNRHFHEFISRKWLSAKEMTFSQFDDLCSSCESLIIKPLASCEGEGIHRVTVPLSHAPRLALFNKYGEGDFIIEECLKQHPGMVFGNTSVNTIRAHSLIDGHGNVHILKSLLRAGVGECVVDNYCAGGCVYEVDNSTGRVISTSLTKDHSILYIHPKTDICMLGYKIPNWDKVIASIKKAHLLIPGCRFIGWDIAITPDGVEYIEGNHNPDYELLEFVGTIGWHDKIKHILENSD